MTALPSWAKVLSLSELKIEQGELALAISTYEGRHRTEARAKLATIAKEMGHFLAALIGAKVKATPLPAAARRRHRENAAHAWPRRGREPKCLVDHIRPGEDPSALAV